MYHYDYPRPALTTDAVVHDVKGNRVLLIKRKNPPFEGKWALPGGFVEKYELPEHACRRELKEETDLDLPVGKMLGVFAEKGRDPRGWMVSVAFLFTIEHPLATQAGSDSSGAAWFSLSELPELAFDHRKILQEAGLI
ncbi:NUDIX domain-containing protein [Cyclobacterium jeungdonense]|uniref:NUDIX hydrolase n=1 Tax=Cyclobacterium jeungdonense TaxID=708087 RepID=A0ABT8C9D4_9BACT|nr:NUDIX hydrolase [Cyclobacterium jeungdonense]MDN3688276.1 NUDIX hydrolase [Cyclobacterium jeungdonense]